jgi:hypothetical protein
VQGEEHLLLIPNKRVYHKNIKDLLQVKNLEAQVDMLRKELRFKSDELALTEENYKEVAIEKQLLEQKVILLEKNKNDETRSLYTMFEQERETL